ncbi:hypothetical protein GGR40_002745 [Novosphingobium gossypii]
MRISRCRVRRPAARRGQRTAVEAWSGVPGNNFVHPLKTLGGTLQVRYRFSRLGRCRPPPVNHSTPAMDKGASAPVLEHPRRAPMLACGWTVAAAQDKLSVVAVAVARAGKVSIRLIKPDFLRFPDPAAKEAARPAPLARSGGGRCRRNSAPPGARAPDPLVQRLTTAYPGIAGRAPPSGGFCPRLCVPCNCKYATEVNPRFAMPSFAALRHYPSNVGGAGAGEVVLAPLHDTVTTRVWDGLSPRLARRFGGAGGR